MKTRIDAQVLPFEKEEFLIAVRGNGQAIASSCRVHMWSESAPQLCYVFTSKRYRRRGHARRMLVDVIKHLARAGKDAVSLWVHKDNNAARSLYADLGFRQVSQSGDQRMMVMFLPSGNYPRGSKRAK